MSSGSKKNLAHKDSLLRLVDVLKSPGKSTTTQSYRHQTATLHPKVEAYSHPAPPLSPEVLAALSAVESRSSIINGYYRVPKSTLDTHYYPDEKEWRFYVGRDSKVHGESFHVRAGLFAGDVRQLDQWRTGGIYILVWKNPNQPLRVYVGKSANIANRVSSHLTEKYHDFTEAILISTVGKPLEAGYKHQDVYHELPGFDEAEMSCLESLCLNMLAAVGSVDILNKNIPNREYIKLNKRGVLAEVVLGTLIFISESVHKLHVPMNSGAQLRIGALCPINHEKTDNVRIILVLNTHGPEARCSDPQHWDGLIPIEALWERHLLYGLTIEGRSLVKRRERARKNNSLIENAAKVIARREKKRDHIK